MIGEGVGSTGLGRFGVSICKKCPVAPVSGMAVGTSLVAGGPVGSECVCVLLTLLLTLNSVLTGSRLFQS